MVTRNASDTNARSAHVVDVMSASVDIMSASVVREQRQRRRYRVLGLLMMSTHSAN